MASLSFGKLSLLYICAFDFCIRKYHYLCLPTTTPLSAQHALRFGRHLRGVGGVGRLVSSLGFTLILELEGGKTEFWLAESVGSASPQPATLTAVPFNAPPEWLNEHVSQ